MQPYNTLLTLSHLADLSDGIILLENEALHRVCQKLYNVPRPAFSVRECTHMHTRTHVRADT